MSVIFDRDARFTLRFWKGLQEALGIIVQLSTTFHPQQTDGQLERAIQVSEDMLRACVFNFGGSWEDHLFLVEFAYNNSYRTKAMWIPLS